jgi:hypothetical protein
MPVPGILGGLMLLGSAETAEARKRGIPLLFFIHTGDEIKTVADLPPERAENPEPDGWALGRQSSHFGITWAGFTTSDHGRVIFKDNTHDDSSGEMRAEMEEMSPFSDREWKLWNRSGWVAIVGLVGFPVARECTGGGD